jgi:exodeoxyribonuclease VII small subunit
MSKPGRSDETVSQTYEQARAELEDVVHRLEAGGVPLEESLALWERGEELARRCQEWLDGARRRLEAAGREPLPLLTQAAGQPDQLRQAGSARGAAVADRDDPATG